MTVNHNIIRARLESERKRLLDQIDQIIAGIHDLQEREGSPFSKREEGATETQELEKLLALERRAREQLAEVEHALSKFEDGTYGLCESCGRQIDLPRLEAIPQARLCMSCQLQREKGVKPKAP